MGFTPESTHQYLAGTNLSLFFLAELYKMVCSNNGTFKDITIPSVMLPRAAGSSLEGALALDEEGTLLI